MERKTTGIIPPFKLLFVCKLCRTSFSLVDQFIVHKKEKHFQSFQKTKCIIFEENSVDLEHVSTKLLNFIQDGTVYLDSQNPHQGQDPSQQDPFSTQTEPKPEQDSSAGVTEVILNIKCELSDYENEDSESEINSYNENENNIKPEEPSQSLLLLPHANSNYSSQALTKAEIDYDHLNEIFPSDPTNLFENATPIPIMKCEVVEEFQAESNPEDKEQDSPKFKCPHCPKKYSKLHNLKVHAESHNSKEEEQEKRPFICSFCGVVCRLKSNLMNHERTHTGERPFPCPLPNCSQAFKTKSDLSRHGKIHSDSKPFHCPVPGCRKMCKFRWNIKVHLKSHLPEEAKLYMDKVKGRK